MYNTISLFSRPYYNPCSQCYYNIITLNLPPKGPLLKLTRRVFFNPLSPFKTPSECGRLKTCGLGLRTLRNNNCSELMTVDEVPDLFSFLSSNGYKIDTSITKMLNQSSIRFETNEEKELIAIITYEK